MTHACPTCGATMRLSRVVDHGTFASKRRDCPQCGHADAVHVREEVLKIIEVAKREKKSPKKVRPRTLRRPAGGGQPLP